MNKDCEHYWAESEYLPVNAVLDYWCGVSLKCKEAKKHAIISALERGLIQYKRADGKNFNDPFLELIGKNIILIHRESFVTWSERIDKNAAINLPLSERSETTYLNIIFALVDCITGSFKNETFSSEAQLRDFIDKKFDGYYGLSSRTLAEKFSMAKKSIKL